MTRVSKHGRFLVIHTYMLHVWNIYLHLVDFMVNVGKYSIHGAFGIVFQNNTKKTLRTGDFWDLG